MNDSMPIDAAPGTKVKMAYPNYGWDSDINRIKRLQIKQNQICTVEYTDIYDSYTHLFLEEYPGEQFNTVNWALVEEAHDDYDRSMKGI